MYNSDETSAEVLRPGGERTYKFDVISTNSTCVSVEAKSLGEAYRKVDRAWKEGRIALSSIDNHAMLEVEFVEMTDEEEPSLKDWNMFRKLTRKELETRATEPHGPMRYRYFVRETLEKEVLVTASSEEEAHEKVSGMYSDYEIELVPDDWADTEFVLDDVLPIKEEGEGDGTKEG